MAVLSIQSSVSLGHVGNAAAVLPLQRLGHEVWPVDTVRFSNHPGHGAWRGRVLAPDEVGEIIAGIEDRGAFARCRAVLSGYLGSAATGRLVGDTVARVKAAADGALYCCDPVIGDSEEGVYVADDLARLFATDLVPAADIVVPNAFELAHITGRPVTGVEAALAAADTLRALGPECVVVTSLAGSGAETPAGEDAGALATLAVDDGGAWVVETPRLATAAKGAGDVLAALFLGHHLNGRDSAGALADAVSSVFAVLAATAAAGADELSLVAAQESLAAPGDGFTARRLR
jgi:pyridoxine kinase